YFFVASAFHGTDDKSSLCAGRGRVSCCGGRASLHPSAGPAAGRTTFLLHDRPEGTRGRNQRHRSLPACKLRSRRPRKYRRTMSAGNEFDYNFEFCGTDSRDRIAAGKGRTRRLMARLRFHHYAWGLLAYNVVVILGGAFV